jgi:SAM-dependent methyltransferase
LAVERDFESYFKEFEALPFERHLEKFRHKRLLELIGNYCKQSSRVLEIGPGRNPVFPKLKKALHVDVLEPIIPLYQILVQENLHVEEIVIHNKTLDEAISVIEGNYDCIILSSVLHEIPHQNIALLQSQELLREGGKLFIVVPNSMSIHRLIGLHSGLISELSDLTTTEMKMQQFISYNPQTLVDQLVSLNFNILSVSTGFVKLFTHAKMQELIENGIVNDEVLEFFYKASDHLDAFGSEIFAVVTK